MDKRAEIGVCVLIAAADGEISEPEIRELSRRLGTLLGESFPPLAVGVAVDEEIGRMHQLGPERYIESLASRFQDRDPIPALRAALAVAMADGLQPEEERMFHDVAKALGLAPTDAADLLATARA